MDDARREALREKQRAARESEQRTARARRALHEEIRAAHEAGDGYGTIAVELGITKARVAQIVSGA